MMRLVLLVTAVCVSTVFAQPPASRQADYVDDDDARRLADLTFQAYKSGDDGIRIVVAATGPSVEPIGGYRGIAGYNRYTAEELDLILRRQHNWEVVTIDADGTTSLGNIKAGRTGTLWERHLRSDNTLNFLRPVTHLPISIQISAGTSSHLDQLTLVMIDGQPRLRCRYRIVDGAIHDLQVQSLGSDGFLADIREPGDGQPQGISVRSPDVDDPVDETIWNQRDREGKWVLMSRQFQDSPQKLYQWVAWLTARKEFELLEWLAIYEPDAFKSFGVGEALWNADAPQAIRVAAWHRNAAPYIGHARQTATSFLLEKKPAIVEHWLATHQSDLDNWTPGLVAVYESLQADKLPPKDSSDSLPPLDLDRVFRHLFHEGKLEAFGQRSQADPDVVYVHQMNRAIKAVAVSGRRSPKLLKRVRQLTRHPNQTIRVQALLAQSYSLTSGASEPVDDLLALVDDVSQDTATREAALMGVSYQWHPAIRLKLMSIAANPAHPAWKAAVSRLGDISDGESLALLRKQQDRELDQEQRRVLGDSIRRIQERTTIPRVFAQQIAEATRLVSLAQATRHAEAEHLVQWLKTYASAANSKQRTKALTGHDWPSMFRYRPLWIPTGVSSWDTRYADLLQQVTAADGE